jgi:hypothetical protein
MNHRQPEKPKASPRAVGKMRIELHPKQDARGPASDVDLTILTDTRPIKLRGIVACEQRPGWVTLDVPSLEAWAEPLKWVTPPERERIESAEFYQLLREHVTRKWAARRPVPG